MSIWRLIGIMNDNLPDFPSPPAPGPGFKMMAFQWWKNPGAGWQLQSGGTSIQASADRLWFTVVDSSGEISPGGGTMAMRFQKINESDGTLSAGSPLSASDTQIVGQGISVASQSIPGFFNGALLWDSGDYDAINEGLYTVSIAFNGPNGAGKYYLDPLLRVDPGSGNR